MRTNNADLLAVARRALDLLREFHDDYRDHCVVRHPDGSILAGPNEDDAEHLQTIKEVIDDLEAAISPRGTERRQLRPARNWPDAP